MLLKPTAVNSLKQSMFIELEQSEQPESSRIKANIYKGASEMLG